MLRSFANVFSARRNGVVYADAANLVVWCDGFRALAALVVFSGVEGVIRTRLY